MGDCTKGRHARDDTMSRVCKFTGRRSSAGRTYTHRGKAKYLGGVGTKVTGKTKRTFKPNIQTVTAIVDGSVQRIKVSTKAMKMGLVTKPLRRKYAYRPETASEDAVVDTVASEAATTSGSDAAEEAPVADA